MGSARELEPLHHRICAILDCAGENVVLRPTADGLVAMRTYDVANVLAWARHASLIGSAEQLLDWARRARRLP